MRKRTEPSLAPRSKTRVISSSSSFRTAKAKQQAHKDRPDYLDDTEHALTTVLFFSKGPVGFLVSEAGKHFCPSQAGAVSSARARFLVILYATDESDLDY